MTRYLSFAFILIFGWLWNVPPSQAEASSAAKLEMIRKERIRLAEIKNDLESKLGALGVQLRQLDKRLQQARAARREVQKKVEKTQEQLLELRRRRRHLEKRIEVLKQHLLDEAAAAWERAGRRSPWLSLLSGVPMSEIPHRQYMLNRLMQSQDHERREFARDVLELEQVEQALRQQQEKMDQLLAERKKAERDIEEKVKAKQVMMHRVRQNLELRKQRDMELAREEKALRRLLEGFRGGLLTADKSSGWQEVRKRKGRLHWPLRGRIVARFGSRPNPSLPPLSGVRLAPLDKTKKVVAVAAGQVRYADWFGGYGLMMIVDHGDGILSVYAHNDVLYKQLGDWVEEGELLAEAGSTGWVDDVRLYFEVRDRGKAVNPARWCRR